MRDFIQMLARSRTPHVVIPHGIVTTVIVKTGKQVIHYVFYGNTFWRIVIENLTKSVYETGRFRTIEPRGFPIEFSRLN